MLNEKDHSIVRMSALKAAVDMTVAGKDEGKSILDIAARFEQWIVEGK
jgi:hypothetical protein